MNWDWAMALAAGTLAAGTCGLLAAAAEREARRLRMARVELSERRPRLAPAPGSSQHR